MLVFQLGTNNWQRGGEFAPGSGILHESHHLALGQIRDVSPYSMFPSQVQRGFVDDSVKVFELDHPIPICESISPNSDYRWHSMSDADFQSYRDRLVNEADEMMQSIEAQAGEQFGLLVAHHTFLNPLAVKDINERRVARGQERVPVLCFVHGTALKMYLKEMSAESAEEFPERFRPLMESEGVFSADGGVIDWCAAISGEQVKTFSQVFPDFPKDKVILSPNGYNQSVFFQNDEVYENREAELASFTTVPYEGSQKSPEPVELAVGIDSVVVFCGKFADWKRLDALLKAAQIYEPKLRNVVTVIAGSGPLEDQKHYQDLAFVELGLKNAFFVGPQSQQELNRLFNVADIACFPSKNEPFGMVFTEAMGCGTPVIGANSGGPKGFVTSDVGHLVEETDDNDALAASLAEAIEQAISQDWKRSKGETASTYAKTNFSNLSQVQDLLAATVGAD